MNFPVESGPQGPYNPVPVGRYKGRILQVVYVGSVPGFQGKVSGEVQIGFEIDHRTQSGNYAVVHKQYGASMHAMSKLRQLIEMVESRTLSNAEALSYSVASLVNKQVWVQVGIRYGRPRPDGTMPIYDKVDSIFPSIESFASNKPTLAWDVRKDDIGVLPQRLQKRAMESVEFRAKHSQPVVDQQYAFGSPVAGTAVYQQPQQPQQYQQPQQQYQQPPQQPRFDF